MHMSTAQFASGSLSEALSGLDEDEDGSISSEEFGLDEASEEVQAFFEAADSDDDGSLSTEELDAVQQALAQQMQQAMGGARGPGGPGGPPPGPPPGEEEDEDAISALDTNGDGVVSAEEYGLDSATDEVQQLFAAIDTDGDENLSAEEVASFKETMAAEMQAQGMPPGPPPPRPRDASTTSTDSADVQAVLQRLAEGYLSLMAGSDSSSGSSSFSTVA
jgi:Ca2+-binding EF-hand superfamily protein